MTIALCLQMCDRPEATARTLHSLTAHVDLGRFRLLAADDASVTSENIGLADQHGFTLVSAPRTTRIGMSATRRELALAAARAGAEWVFLLENDIDILRPFPWDLFTFVAGRPDVYCLRLFGRYKDAAQTDACLDVHKRTRRPAGWRPLKGAPEPAQIGRIHWSAQPAVTRTADLVRLLTDGAESSDRTVRVKRNVTGHFGARTEGRVK